MIGTLLAQYAFASIEETRIDRTVLSKETHTSSKVGCVSGEEVEHVSQSSPLFDSLCMRNLLLLQPRKRLMLHAQAPLLNSRQTDNGHRAALAIFQILESKKKPEMRRISEYGRVAN